MKFFKTATPLLSWNEPRFFAARTRDRRGWLLRGLLALAVFSLMLTAIAYDRNNPAGRGPKFSIAGGVLISAVIGVFLTAMLDAPDFERNVTISDDSVSTFGNAGHHVSMTTTALRDVRVVRLIPPEEFGRTFGAMELVTHRGMTRIGVPASLSMSRVAEVLHGQGIRVLLTGWSPGEFVAQTGNDPTASAPVSRPSAAARIERLGEGEAGRILTPTRLRVTLMMVLGPLAFSTVLGLALAGYGGFRLKFGNPPRTTADLAAGIGGMALFFLGFWYTSRFANLLPMLYMRKVARSVIELRPGALFNPRDPEAVYVDVVPRQNWGKAMLRQYSDSGMLMVDELTRAVLFEGDQERWRIPAPSLVSVEVESYRPAGHVEGQEAGEVFYLAVIRAHLGGGEVWEAPVSKCHVEFRPKGNRLRQANANALRDRIRALMPVAASPAR